MLVHHLNRLFLTFAILCFMLVGSPNVSRAANLGVHDDEVAGVQVILLSVKRTSDGFLTLKWAYHNTTDSSKTIDADSGAQSATNWPWSLAWDTYVEAGNTKYVLIKDQTGTPLAGTHSAGTGPQGQQAYILAPHTTFTTWAKLAAPPKDVTKVTVYILGTDPFEDIPII